MRRVFKQCAEGLLGNDRAVRVLAKCNAPTALILAFHNVLAEGERPRGDRSLHLSISTFREILDWLAETYEFVRVDNLVSASDKLNNRPQVAITFDDAYVGALSEAIPELAMRGIPATIFAVTGVERGHTFWWDALADGFPDGLPSDLRGSALTSARGREDEVRRWAIENSLPMSDLSGPFVAASWTDIARVERMSGIEIASHTRTHANLAALAGDELMSELADAKAELTARIPAARPWLAYPYGLSSAAVERAAQQAGYELAVRVEGGPILRRHAPPPPFRLPRLNVPAGISLAGFRMRAVGLLGQ